MATRTKFESHNLTDLAESGWLLALNPQKIAMGWGQWQESAEPPNDPNTCAVYSPDFYLQDDQPWKWTEHWDILNRDQFTSLAAPLVLTGMGHNVNSPVSASQLSQSNEISHKVQWLEPTLKNFEKVWWEIQTGFRDRHLKKAVPAVFAEASSKVTATTRLKMFKALSELPNCLYPYGIWSENSGLIGATPEHLFSRLGDRIETMALAGTRGKVGALDSFELMKDPKERFEHQLVLEDIVERLSILGDVTIGQTGVLELPTLFHLQTIIRLEAPKASFMKLIERLHPTPALGVAPREAGFQEMRRWDDSTKRRRFGAPFGIRGMELEHCVVAIRNIQWQDTELLLGSGCGVVPESQIDREWQELKLKRESVKRMLGI